MDNHFKEKERADKLAAQFARKEGFNAFLTEYRVKKILEYLKGKKTLLDIGCSYGRIAKMLSPFFKKIVAVDGSNDLISQAIKENSAENISYIASLIEDFKLEEKFDAVLLSFILEHVAEPTEVIRKASGFLKEKGILFLMVPNAESLHRRVGKSMGLIKELNELTSQDVSHGHRRVYTMEGISKEVISAGLKINDMGTYFIKPFSNAQMESVDGKICDALYEISNDIKGLGSMIFVSASLK